jgi:type I restriction enzyme S subunit
MMDGLKPYPSYKQPRLSWLERVPAHWVEERSKVLFREVDERSTTGTEPLMSVSHVTGVTLRKSNVTMFMAESTVGHKICRPNDIVINTMWAFMGALGVAYQEGVVSPSYGVYRSRQTGAYLPNYLDRLLRTSAYTAEYTCRSTGITSSRLRLYPDQFLRIPLLRPPIEEQVAIVRFLDHADRLIRRYIRAKKKLIALLIEQKQAIIHQAVARGLDPSVRLLPSGFEWLGCIPASWGVSRVKNEFECLNNRRVPLSSTERGMMSSRQYDYFGASGVIDKVDSYLFDDELLLLAEDGANLVLRNLPLAIIARGKFWVNNHAHILKPRRGNLEFLAAVMESLNCLPWISGAAQPKLTKDRLMSIAIAVPEPQEQDRIIASLKVTTEPLRITIEQAKREVDLLQEYRTRLIADFVTGKLDVREAAACLPVEVAAPEAIEEAEDLAGSGEEMEDPDLEEAMAEAEA